MILQQKILERLRQRINEETEYPSGPKVVVFFNNLGFRIDCGQGFLLDEHILMKDYRAGIRHFIGLVGKPHSKIILWLDKRVVVT